MRKCRMVLALFLLALPLAPLAGTVSLGGEQTDLASASPAIEPQAPPIRQAEERPSRSENIVVMDQAGTSSTAPPPSTTLPTPRQSTTTTTKPKPKPTTTVAPKPATAPPAPVGGSVESVARAQVGKAYRSGATGPNAFDCSGLVYYVYNQAGISIPRLTSEGYYGKYTKVSRDQLQPGDLVWSPGHIGIYVGNGQMVHASTPRGGVKLASMNAPRPQGFVRVS